MISQALQIPVKLDENFRRLFVLENRQNSVKSFNESAWWSANLLHDQLLAKKAKAQKLGETSPADNGNAMKWNPKRTR